MIEQLATDRPLTTTLSLGTTPFSMETRPYAPYDLYWLDTVTPVGWFDASTLRRCVDPALSVSFCHNEGYLGSAGLFALRQGVYEAWLVLLVPPPFFWGFIVQVRRAIQLGERLTHAHRLQSTCMAEYAQGIGLARRLGFKLEGCMEAATPTKTDLLLFAKVIR